MEYISGFVPYFVSDYGAKLPGRFCPCDRVVEPKYHGKVRRRVALKRKNTR